MKDAKDIPFFPTRSGENNLNWLQNSFLFPDYAATVLFVVLGRELRLVWFACHQQTTQEAKSKMLQRTWRRLFGLMRLDLGPGQRHDDDAQRPSQPADLKKHVHHTSWTYLWGCTSMIPYGHNQTKLTFICGFSLNPPPPPPPVRPNKKVLFISPEQLARMCWDKAKSILCISIAVCFCDQRKIRKVLALRGRGKSVCNIMSILHTGVHWYACTCQLVFQQQPKFNMSTLAFKFVCCAVKRRATC